MVLSNKTLQCNITEVSLRVVVEVKKMETCGSLSDKNELKMGVRLKGRITEQRWDLKDKEQRLIGSQKAGKNTVPEWWWQSFT